MTIKEKENLIIDFFIQSHLNGRFELSIPEIQRKTELSRSDILVALTSLATKGVVTAITKGSGKKVNSYFSLTRIREIINKNKSYLLKLKDELKTI